MVLFCVFLNAIAVLICLKKPLDALVALCSFNSLFVILIILLGVYLRVNFLLDVAIVYALFGFISVLMYHKFFTKSMKKITDNPFENFGLKPVFTVDLDKIEEAYIKLQRLYHPDHATSANKMQYEQISAVINEHYSILKSPIKRAEILLKLRFKKTLSDINQSEYFDILQETFELEEMLEESPKMASQLILNKYEQNLAKLSLTSDEAGFTRLVFSLKYLTQLKNKCTVH